MVECICGDGSSVALLVVFKGWNGSTEWFQSPEIPGNWQFSVSENGWTSNIHGLKWLQLCFDSDTWEKAERQYRLLILDGHGSHVTGSFIMHCMDHWIALIRLSPHTSHVLQPLDVGYFGPLKTALSNYQDKLFRLHVARICKIEWLIAYVKARCTAFRYDNVLGGWSGAGLIPLNPEKILRKLVPATWSTLNSRKSDHAVTSSPPSTPHNDNILETTLLDSSPPNASYLR